MSPSATRWQCWCATGLCAQRTLHALEICKSSACSVSFGGNLEAALDERTNQQGHARDAGHAFDFQTSELTHFSRRAVSGYLSSREAHSAQLDLQMQVSGFSKTCRTPANCLEIPVARNVNIVSVLSC